ncbi:MAG: hypothetical protein B6241_05230 [Spirochaetaceae bacterium 4572_59]|nr:MAG: hypothetical protein B6241_05230 [Spirochaetaceae bacterium 4572_59]
MSLEQPFLSKQIIAYIGNKRKLLNLISRGIDSLNLGDRAGIKFLDIFAGSGVVSRLGKSLGFEVYSNDWEFYSYILNRGFILTNSSDIARLFGSEEAFLEELERLNTLPEPPDEERYIAHYYAPATFDLQDVDYRTQRLFYTRHNALVIDKIRNEIDRAYPGGSGNPDQEQKRDHLIGLLVYEAATHTNTSGVFKAFHKGFGGHSRDALTRILAPIRLRPSELIDSDYPVHIYRKDANDLVKQLRGMDIAYLDPPYNQHQYGSNYHMLNTIARWDKIAAPLDLNEKGELKEKAAIRKDWKDTRSNYCYKNSAASAFADLLQNLDARYILISYSTDGIIPFEEMKDICRRKGRLKIVTNEYTKYRGGKQSNSRLNTNVEFILIVDTTVPSTPASMRKVDRVIGQNRLRLLFKNNFSREKLQEQAMTIGDGKLVFKLIHKELEITSRDYFELIPPDNLDDLSLDEIFLLSSKLQSSLCLTKEEELNEILSKIDADPDRNLYFIRLIPDRLKKLAHKKNKNRFYHYLEEIRAIESHHRELYSLIKKRIDSIEQLAEKRFTN